MVWIKVVHMSLAGLTIAGFLLRSWWLLRESSLLQTRVVRILPHIVDTLLLASGVTLAVMTKTNPLEQDWLLTKILLLLVYIASGSVALKYAQNKAQRSVAFVIAICAVGNIVYIARNKHLLFG